jgi:glyoxylase-like metal-dependent hydrolase (beta-lactamase superfamily II)
MKIKGFFDQRTSTLTYIVHDPASRDAVVIDPVLDYDPAASATSYESVNRITRYLREHDLTLHFILETHAHADHLSGSQVLKRRFPGAAVAIGERITQVQSIFKSVFDMPEGFPTDGSQFDRLFRDGESVNAGTLGFDVIFTPGHTPACVTYRFGDAVFTGDALFMPDMGTGRCDFPAGSAEDLYESITRRLYTLPDDTRVFVGHDYQPEGRELAYETTIGEEKARNVQLPASRSKDDFVAFRRERDKKLAAPRLLLQSVQVNVDAGSLPGRHPNRLRYFQIPINAFRPDSDEEIALEKVPG